MAEMNGAMQLGNQPASGGAMTGSVTGGFEMVGAGMGMSPPSSTVGGLSMTDVTLEQALARMHELVRENAELRGKLCVCLYALCLCAYRHTQVCG